jgi:hypothetical protein
MKRKNFLQIAGGTVLAAGGLGYAFSDKSNFVRADSEPGASAKSPLAPDEREILYLASLAPSGHNTQPWFVTYIEPYHWIIGNDKRKWLPAVDPAQRETILSIGAFLQNLVYAASSAGYRCQVTVLATMNQAEEIAVVKLTKSGHTPGYDVSRIKNRRTVRSNYLPDALTQEDQHYLFGGEPDFFHFFSNTTTEYRFLNEQTIAATRVQSDRDAAQRELSEWVRFSSSDARKKSDGLTTASMEIGGLAGFFVRNTYDKGSVMKKNFRDQNVDTVRAEVAQSAGWLLITSRDNATAALLETGQRMQRLFLNVRDKGVAMHPMTQILEEPQFSQTINKSVGLPDPIQFILRLGYVKNYPDPVSVRRPVDWFVRT